MALMVGRALVLLVLLALSASAAKRKETFPVRRPLVDLREAALQLVGRDGPRYPDEGFLRAVHASRAPYKPGGAAPEDAHSQFQLTDCEPSYAILTIANNFAMQHLVPLLLQSLQRIAQPALAGGAPGDLTRHTTVVGVTPGADQLCGSLAKRFSHRCQGDGSSGLSDGDNLYPGHRALAYGFAKLKYIVNALTTNVDILYLDADVVLLQDPFPGLLALNADFAVATAPEPCGARAVVWDPDQAEAGAQDAGGAAASSEGGGSGAAAGGSQQEAPQRRRALDEEGAAAAGPAVLRYDTGVSYYRSAPGTLRCAYALLLDMAHLAQSNVSVVWETERYAAFMPQCAGALGLALRALPAEQYVSSCGGEVGPEARRAAVAVHASVAPGSASSLRERVPLMGSLLGIERAGGEGGDGEEAGAAR